MKNIQKSLASIVIGVVYIVSTSIFAHLVTMGGHHSIEVSEYQHSDGSIHEHREVDKCDSKKCEYNCNNIEKGKTTNTLSSTTLVIIRYISYVFPTLTYQIHSATSIEHGFIVKTGPPVYQKFLSYTDLIGVIRIIG